MDRFPSPVGRLAVVVLSIAALSACEEDEGPTGPGAFRDPEGLVYRAELLQGGDVILAGEVTIENRSDEPRTLRFPDNCPALLRIYFPESDALAWDQRDVKTGCRERETAITIEPGESMRFGVNGTSIAILGTSLREGTYRLVAYLQPIGEPEIELSLGTVTLALPDD